MSFHTPQHGTVQKEQVLPGPGHYDCTISDIRAQVASSGNPMMIFEYTIDNGEFAGFSADEVYVFFDYDGPDRQHPTWQALQQISDCCGFEWDQAQSVEAFAAQWPIGQLRVRVDLVHEYSVEACWAGESKYDVDSISEEYDEDHPNGAEWVTVTPRMYDDYGGKKNKGLAVRDGFDVESIYQEVEAEREMEFSEEDDFTQDAIPQGDGAPARTNAGGNQRQQYEDDLPF